MTGGAEDKARDESCALGAATPVVRHVTSPLAWIQSGATRALSFRRRTSRASSSGGKEAMINGTGLVAKGRRAAWQAFR